ncbi:MAG TPA: alpha/beta hydrolase-fold protein [Streptosporangiales bacterium]
MGSTTATAPAVSGDEVVFRLADPGHELRGVRLWQDVGLPGGDTWFTRTPDGWSLRVPRPPVDRLEYLFELRRRDGTELVLDPANPRSVDGAFGAHSVLEFPGYRAPWWLDADGVASRRETVDVDAPGLGGTVDCVVWSPADAAAREPLPLLVVHDGPAYDRLGGLTGYTSAMIAAGRLPRHRVALLAPGRRDEWYSANPAYADALCETVLPALTGRYPSAAPFVGVGASLGALALLHAQRRHPHVFGGLFLQSGSYFVPVHDHMEASFPWFGRVARWVAAAGRAGGVEPVRAVLTCGTVEENLRNNQLMHRLLSRQHYAARLVAVRDAHNYTGWRDCLDPHLTSLLRQVWRA